MKFTLWFSIICCTYIARFKTLSKIASIAPNILGTVEKQNDFSIQVNNLSIQKMSTKVLNCNCGSSRSIIKTSFLNQNITNENAMHTIHESKFLSLGYYSLCKNFVEKEIFETGNNDLFEIRRMFIKYEFQFSLCGSDLSVKLKKITDKLNWKITNIDLANYFKKLAETIDYDKSIDQNICNLVQTISLMDVEYRLKDEFVDENYVPILNLIMRTFNYETISNDHQMFTAYMFNGKNEGDIELILIKL